MIHCEVAVQVRLPLEAKMKNKDPKWIRRWDTWIATKATRPGVWRRKGGGYLVRGRAKDPLTGKLKQYKKRVDGVDSAGAYQVLQRELQCIREGRVQAASTRTSFGDYAVLLLERKVAQGKIKSAKSRERWAGTLENILIPWFGRLYVDEIRRAMVLAWMDHVAGLIEAGTYAPSTANSWLSILRVVINSYIFEHELERNPISGVEDFDTSLHPTYSEEEPNSLTPKEVPVFLVEMLKLHPQHYAMVALGFGTGLRPSSMRPLRRRGATPDLLWDLGVLFVRRSHTRKQEVMETTKSGRHQRLKLPEELMEILRWHVEHLTPKRSRSDLLFPPRWGDGFMSSSALDKPFKDVVASLRKQELLSKKITPRAMRRTFQDLARAVEVKDVVTRAISGHATEQMQRHYSTVNAAEMEQSIGKVISLARAREVLREKHGSMAGGTGSGTGGGSRFEADGGSAANKGAGGTEGGTERPRKKKTAG